MTKSLAVTYVPPSSLKPYAAQRAHPHQAADPADRRQHPHLRLHQSGADRRGGRHHRRPRPSRRRPSCWAMRVCPTIRLSTMTEAQKRAYVIADNRLAEQRRLGSAAARPRAAVLERARARFRARRSSASRPPRSTSSSRAWGRRPTIRPTSCPNCDGPAVSRLGDLWQLGGPSPALRRRHEPASPMHA